MHPDLLDILVDLIFFSVASGIYVWGGVFYKWMRGPTNFRKELIRYCEMHENELDNGDTSKGETS